MSHDRRYLRDLLQLRGTPRAPVLWLLVPWLVGIWWSTTVARVLLPAQPPLSAPGQFFFLMIVGRFLLVGGIGFIATWAWLYLAWPDHPRVFCWVALAALVGVWVLPTTVFAVLPLFISLCMSCAVIEQAIAFRRREHARAPVAPAV